MTDERVARRIVRHHAWNNDALWYAEATEDGNLKLALARARRVLEGGRAVEKKRMLRIIQRLEKFIEVGYRWAGETDKTLLVNIFAKEDK